MNGFIYIIRNTINDKVYIGQTKTSVETRWKEHLRHARYGDQVINRAMNKYGIDKFYVETLEICDLDVLDEREIYYIELYNSTNKSKGYNVSIGGKTPKFKRKVLSISTLIDLYKNQGFTLDYIANKYNVTRYIITTELRNAGVEINDRYRHEEVFSKLDRETILNVLNEHKSLRKAAKALNMNYTTFRKACIYNNIEYNSSKSAQHTF